MSVRRCNTRASGGGQKSALAEAVCWGRRGGRGLCRNSAFLSPFYCEPKTFLYGKSLEICISFINLKSQICSSKSKFKNRAELAEYSKQLYIYALAIKNKYGKFPKKLMFNMFRKGNWITVDFDMEKYEETLKWVDDIVNEIETCMNFEPNGLGSFYCFNFCPYRYKCEYNE